MEELIDFIATDAPPSQITDQIKGLLFNKASEKINLLRPEVSSFLFDKDDQLGEQE